MRLARLVAQDGKGKSCSAAAGDVASRWLGPKKARSAWQPKPHPYQSRQLACDSPCRPGVVSFAMTGSALGGQPQDRRLMETLATICCGDTTHSSRPSPADCSQLSSSRCNGADELRIADVPRARSVGVHAVLM